MDEEQYKKIPSGREVLFITSNENIQLITEEMMLCT